MPWGSAGPTHARLGRLPHPFPTRTRILCVSIWLCGLRQQGQAPSTLCHLSSRSLAATPVTVDSSLSLRCSSRSSAAATSTERQHQMFSTTADRQLVARSSMGSLQGQCGQFRPLLPGQHVHAGRRTSSHKRPGSIAAAPFPTPSALGSGPAGVFEEDIEAIAVLERPGAVPSTLFHQHDQAMQQLQELQAFNSELSSAIADADLVLEKAEWNTLVLPVSCLRDGSRQHDSCVAAAGAAASGCSPINMLVAHSPVLPAA